MTMKALDLDPGGNGMEWMVMEVILLCLNYFCEQTALVKTNIKLYIALRSALTIKCAPF